MPSTGGDQCAVQNSITIRYCFFMSSTGGPAAVVFNGRSNEEKTVAHGTGISTHCGRFIEQGHKIGRVDALECPARAFTHFRVKLMRELTKHRYRRF